MITAHELEILFCLECFVSGQVDLELDMNVSGGVIDEQTSASVQFAPEALSG